MLAAAVILFTSAAPAQDLSGLTDDELLLLWQDVLAEMGNRGLDYAAPPSQDDTEKAAVLKRLSAFFGHWSRNSLDDMLPLCSSGWKESVENPRTALFGLMGNRTPRSLETVAISGEYGDTDRTVTAYCMIDRNNGKGAYRYRMEILMKKESDGLWYIDPASLNNCELADDSYPTPEPTETPAGLNDGTLLYYFPGGGSYYHLDPYCKRVNEKYLPLEGCFTYGELKEGQHIELVPCVICHAPLR